MELTGADHLTKLGGPFYGNALSRTKLNIELETYWKPDRAAKEPERVNQTWFDYRFAHSALRLMFFTHQYTLAWRRAHIRFFDRDQDVSDFVPWRSRNIYRCSEQLITRTIDTMHVADELRMPYEVFFDAGFHYLLQDFGYVKVKSNHRGLSQHKLPPIRMFSRADVAIAAQKRFDILTQRNVIHATHPYYRADNWKGAAWQQEHVQWLQSEALRRGKFCDRHLEELVSRGIISSFQTQVITE